MLQPGKSWNNPSLQENNLELRAERHQSLSGGTGVDIDGNLGGKENPRIVESRNGSGWEGP